MSSSDPRLLKEVGDLVFSQIQGRTAILQLPPDIPAGEHRVLVIIDEQPLPKKTETKEKRPPLDFPVIHVGSWPENLSLRREDMYGDWER